LNRIRAEKRRQKRAKAKRIIKDIIYRNENSYWFDEGCYPDLKLKMLALKSNTIEIAIEILKNKSPRWGDNSKLDDLIRSLETELLERGLLS
jgi:hypothetical protein